MILCNNTECHIRSRLDAGYCVGWQRTKRCCWHGWSWHRWLLHDDGQSCWKILPLQFHLDQLHGYRKLQPIHLTIFIHISQGPNIYNRQLLEQLLDESRLSSRFQFFNKIVHDQDVLPDLSQHRLRKPRLNEETSCLVPYR